MNVKGKTIRSVLLSLAAMFCMVGILVPSGAAQAADDAVPSSMVGMQRFIESDDNQVSFDEERALQAGYDPRDVETVSTQVATMNEQLAHHDGVLVDSGTVAVENTGSMLRAAVRGVNKTVYHWWGVTEFWMDSSRAQQFIKTLERGSGWVNYLPGFPVRVISKAIVQTWLQGARNAAKPGRGIIAYQQLISGTSTVNMWFASQ